MYLIYNCHYHTVYHIYTTNISNSIVVILYYHRKQAALLPEIYSQGTDRKENTLWTVSNKAFIVVPCLVVTRATFFAASKHNYDMHTAL
jgi:hypothetical protein